MNKKKIYIILGSLAVILFISILIIIIAMKKENELNKANADVPFSTVGLSSDDSQSYWSALGHNVARGEQGYYFLSDIPNYIMYFDIETHTSFPLCGKAECKHNDNTCNAYLGSGTHLKDSIYYYNGSLYLLKLSYGNAILERANADGSGRQDICTIGPNTGLSSIKLVFHNDCVYIFDGVITEYEETKKIEKITLDGKSRETIFEYTGTNLRISYGKSYGSKLFYIVESRSVNDNNTISLNSLGLFYYDYLTKESGKVMDESICDYAIDEKNNLIYYYVDCDGLYKMDINTKDKVKIFQATDESGTVQLSYDGNYLYLSNLQWSSMQSKVNKIDKKIWVVDDTGNIINIIPGQGVYEMYFGDKDFIFANKSSGTGNGDLAYIDKSNITNAKEWNNINSAYDAIINKSQK